MVKKTLNDLVEEYLLKHPDKNYGETLIRFHILDYYYHTLRPRMKFWWDMGMKTNHKDIFN